MLCFDDNEGLYSSPVWIAQLSDGRKVYKDSDTAWTELHDYCNENGLHVENMFIRFRSHLVHIPPAEGYYFGMGCGAGTGWGSTDTHQLFLVGRLVGDIIYVTEYKVPEMEVMWEDQTRDPKTAGKKLIRVQKTNQEQQVSLQT